MNWRRNWQRTSVLGLLVFTTSFAWSQGGEENKKQSELVEKFDKILGLKPEQSTPSTAKVDTVMADISDTVNYLMNRWERAEKQFLALKYGGQATVNPPLTEQVKDLEGSYFVSSYFKEKEALHIYFAHDQAQVDLSIFHQLKDWAEQMKAQPQLHLDLHGYTDQSGTSTYNENLSQKRAEFVRAYLVNQFGIDASRIHILTHGEEGGDRVHDTELDFLNRRVDLVWKMN
ncbi:MAG: OmpA family protein [Crocinitomicaceae bacterium]|jgi:outer membrane protein OmpA-like peptidoglycan-associated protein|nr:OmpA family protein [Crocinitomicaceae bacterium]